MVFKRSGLRSGVRNKSNLSGSVSLVLLSLVNHNISLFVGIIGEGVFYVYVYVLMINHVRLLVAPRKKNGLFKVIQMLGRYYVQYFNYKIAVYRHTMGAL